MLLVADALDPFAEPNARDPYPAWAELRRRGRLHRLERADLWLVPRYADVKATIREPRLSSRVAYRQVDRAPPAVRPMVLEVAGDLERWMIFLDPPQHTRIRGLFMRAFELSIVERLRPAITRIVDGLLDAVAAPGELELMAELANVVPVRVIGQLMGLPDEDGRLLKRWSDDLSVLVAGDRRTPGRYERAWRGLADLRDYLGRAVDARRRRPGDDLLSALLRNPELAACELSDDAVLANVVFLLFAGHETTTNLIGNGMAALLTHPAELARLRGPASPPLAVAVEELLRFDSPVPFLMRRAEDPFTFLGQPLEAGATVIASLHAANRDPEWFLAPDRLDVARTANPHLAFGHGRHFCAGAQLARLEGEVTLERLLARFPRLELAEEGDLAWLPLMGFRGLRSLRLRVA